MLPLIIIVRNQGRSSSSSMLYTLDPKTQELAAPQARLTLFSTFLFGNVEGGFLCICQNPPTRDHQCIQLFSVDVAISQQFALPILIHSRANNISPHCQFNEIGGSPSHRMGNGFLHIARTVALQRHRHRTNAGPSLAYEAYARRLPKAALRWRHAGHLALGPVRNRRR